MTAAVLALALLLAIVAIFGWTRFLELRERHDDVTAELQVTQGWLTHANERADAAESRAAAAVRQTADAHRCLAFLLRPDREPVSGSVSEPDLAPVTELTTAATTAKG